MNKQERLSVFAGLYGNALEWYDFLLYASFAPLFADYFFPSDDPYMSLLLTFGVFSIGFIMRPIGGALLGHIGDHYGRRSALILSVSVMTGATSCIALMPSYEQLGITAPLLFTCLRLVQGLAVGGELPGSATYLIEHMFEHRRGFAGSLVLSTAFFGIFMGSVTASILSNLLTEADLSAWGWRLAYALGGLLGIYGIYLRVQSSESPQFKQTTPTLKPPAQLIFTLYRSQLFLSVILTSIMALSNYVLIAYFTTFLVQFENFLMKDALIINLSALFLLTVLIPIFGDLSDRIGHKYVLFCGLYALLILVCPIFYLLMSAEWWLVFLAQILLSLTLAPINATVPTMITELFPTEVRASGTSIGYNLGQALFGGTVPLIALTLIEVTGDKFAPAWYVFLWSGMVIIAVKYFFWRK